MMYWFYMKQRKTQIRTAFIFCMIVQIIYNALQPTQNQWQNPVSLRKCGCIMQHYLNPIDFTMCIILGIWSTLCRWQRAGVNSNVKLTQQAYKFEEACLVVQRWHSNGSLLHYTLLVFIGWLIQFLAWWTSEACIWEGLKLWCHNSENMKNIGNLTPQLF